MSKKKSKRVLSDAGKARLRKYLKVDEEVLATDNKPLTKLRKQAFESLCHVAGHDRCEVCRGPMTTYDRKLHSSMVAVLVAWWGYWGDYGWHTLNDLYDAKPNLNAKRGGDFSKLAHWGFIEEKPKTDENKKNTGIYRITEDGVAFVTGKVKFSRSVFVYNDVRMDFSDDLVSVFDALGDAFDYNELMGFTDSKVVKFKAV